MTMATFVLVPGAFHGGWCYQRVSRRLRAAGHEVYPVTLTGLGERSHLASLPISLETHVLDVVNTIHWEDLQQVVLCGHSYGGIVITGTADRLPERIAALVYLDAVVPEDGQSLFTHDASFEESFAPLAAARGDGLVPPRGGASFGVLDPADIAWVDGKTTPHPIATCAEPLHLSGRYREVAERVFIYAATRRFAARYETFRGLPGTTVHRVEETGHDIMIDRPEVVAELLMRLRAEAAS
jgi:pimeloyl-ACP methyl ester carboxylesterase